MRVLIYTTDSTESAALARLVSYAGHDPVVVSDARKAAAALVAGVVPAAVFDLEHTEAEAIELTRICNSDGRRVETLLVASKPDASLIIECHRLGASDFVLRPISRSEFRGIFDRLSDRVAEREADRASGGRLPAEATPMLAPGLGEGGLGPAQPTLLGLPPRPVPSESPRSPVAEASPGRRDPWSTEVLTAPVTGQHPATSTGIRAPQVPVHPARAETPRIPAVPPSFESAGGALITGGGPPNPGGQRPSAELPTSAGRSGTDWPSRVGPVDLDEREPWPDDLAHGDDHPATLPPSGERSNGRPSGGGLPPLPPPGGAHGGGFHDGGFPEDLNADPARSEARVRHYVTSSEGRLPVPARVVARLARLESEEDPNFDDVIEVVESNTMMVRGIMRQAVSAEQYRGQPPVRTVRECVTRLGTRRVISAALASAMRVNFETRDPDFMRVFGAIWVAQYVASRVAERLCQHLRIPGGESIQNRVLFMDVGEMVICRAAQEYWPNELRGGQLSPNLLRFMHDHVRGLGVFTLRHWGMPEDFAALARRDSRQSGDTTRPNVTRLHIALAAAHAARQCLGPAAGIPAADPVTSDLWNRLGVTEVSVRKIAEEMMVSTKRLLQG
jgi:HD-like signal output (HDOD) protein/DNA-binding response OmpR family regulator